MHASYDDITSRIPEEPKWWDENGTPRYCELEPKACPNIYSRIVIALRISCQACGREFFVMMNNNTMFDYQYPSSLFNQPTYETIHYGDPPRHDDCPAGPTMNCWDLEIEKVWKRANMGDWERQPHLEGRLPDYDESNRPTA